MKRVLYAAVVVGAALAGQVGHAGVLKGDMENCTFLAKVVVNWKQYRDQGVPWERALAFLNGSLATAVGAPSSIVQDEEDMAFVRETMRDLWDRSTELGRAEGAQVPAYVLRKCMNGYGSMGKKGSV